MKRFFFSMLAVAATLVFDSAARADLQILRIEASVGTNTADFTGTGTGASLQTGNGSTTVGGSTTTISGATAASSASFNGIPLSNTLTVNAPSGILGVPGLTFSSTETSNAPGASGNAQVFDSTTAVTNSTGVAQSVTFLVSANNYNSANFPSGSIALTSIISGQLGVRGATATLTSYLDSTNNIDPTGGTPGVPTTLTYPPGGTNDNTIYLPASTLGSGLFSMGEQVVLNIAAGDTVLFQVTSQVTPEPATLAVWGCGLGLIGLVARRRRRAA